MPVAISDLDNFGDVAAEEDGVLNYFLTTNAVERIENGDAFLVLGRKGTGKTAIVRYFTEKGEGNRARALNLRGYPWKIHAAKIDHGASDVEAYVSSWRYLIAVELASLTLAQTGAYLVTAAQSLNNFLNDNYGGVNPSLADILQPKRLRLSKMSFMPAIMGNQIGGVEMERANNDYSFGQELNAVSDAILSAVRDTLIECKAGTLSLHFDELDQGMTTMDEARSKMLIGLVLAAREVKREFDASQVDVNPVIYLRSDLWEELQFSDKNKITQGLTLPLEWNSAGLTEMVEYRIVAKLGTGVTWNDIADGELMRGSQTKWSHILARTFLRPRDVIRFLNGALSEAKKISGADKLTNANVADSRVGYSSYLKSELDDEINPHWPFWSEALQAFSAITTTTFERSDFEMEYDKRRSKENTVTADEALPMLYRFSIIGYRGGIGTGGSSWVFRYTNPEASWDSAAKSFKVHPGLKEYARLREARSS